MGIVTDELRRVAKSYATFVHDDIIESLEERIASWPKLKATIVLVLFFKKKLFNCIRGNRSTKELDQTKQHLVHH